MKNQLIQLKLKVKTRYIIVGLVILILIYLVLRVTGFFAQRTINHNSASLIQQLSLSSPTKYKPTKSCVDEQPTETHFSHIGTCTAYENIAYKIPKYDQGLLLMYLNALNSHGWQSTDIILVTTTPQEAYRENKNLISKLSNKVAQDPINTSLYFSKGGTDLRLLVVDVQGKGTLQDYDLINLGLSRDSLPYVGQNELLLIFHQEKEYLRLSTPFKLPIFKER